MNLHEYQSKQLFAQYAIPIPQGEVAGSAELGSAILKRLKRRPGVTKSAKKPVKAVGRRSAGRRSAARPAARRAK
jgi:succinyl-CoA synthetase beta subunit